MAAAFLLGTIARDLLGDLDAAGYALHPPSISPNPGQVLFPFLSHPPQGPPDRQDRHRDAGRTLICPTADVLADAARSASPQSSQAHHPETLTHGETRVLRYLGIRPRVW